LTVSFRTRLFAVAALIVAAVLAAVIGAGWASLLKAEVDKLDDGLCMEARRIATQRFDPNQLPRLEADVALKLRLGPLAQPMLRFDPQDGEADFRSAGFVSLRWPSALRVQDLQWQDAHRLAPLGPDQPERLDRPPRPDQAPRPPPPPRSPPPPEGRPRPEQGHCALASFSSEGSEWRAARFEVLAWMPSERLVGTSVVAADLANIQAELQSLVRRALRVVVPLALLLTALGAWLLASLTMRPVNRLRVAMKGVKPQALDQRLQSAGEDREFKELIADYNTMLARLEDSFHQASRFSADAAHELKTPLTVLRGRIEQALQRVGAGDSTPTSQADVPSLRADLTDMLDEVGRLNNITRKLLLLSQADAGQLQSALQRAPVDLSLLLDELVADAQMLLTHQTATAQIGRPLHVMADATLMRQLLNNLISNAVRYCAQGGAIHLQAQAQSAGAQVRISNPSQNITAADRARFFERFFRGDPAHNRHVEGNGLGLSLAREIARAHGGDLTLEPGPLNVVTLRLWVPAQGPAT
jgi:two-component system, OmpR family, heavy metal sensor histidine kinase CusS